MAMLLSGISATEGGLYSLLPAMEMTDRSPLHVSRRRSVAKQLSTTRRPLAAVQLYILACHSHVYIATRDAARLVGASALKKAMECSKLRDPVAVYSAALAAAAESLAP